MADDDRKIDFLGMLTEPRRQPKGRSTPRPRPEPPAPEPAPATPANKASAPKATSTKTPKRSKTDKKDASPNRGNYLGSGLYLHKGSEKRKMTAYIDPAIHKEVKVAGASGDDPRGSDMSEIVENALRAYGFGGEA
jgi:hypothetical protein